MAETTEHEPDPRLEAAEEEAERWARALPEVDYERIKKHVIQRDGKPYIQFVGLLDLLHQESAGEFSITTRLEQAPTEANGNLAIVSATVVMAQGHRSASALGDASPQSVNRMIAPHLVRMAETRAKGRALRDLLNIPYVTAEELGPDGPAPAHDQGRQDERRGLYGAGEAQTEGIEVGGRRYSRAQVWAAYTQRMGQMKNAGLLVPPEEALTERAPLSALVGATQRMRRLLEQQAGQN